MDTVARARIALKETADMEALIAALTDAQLQIILDNTPRIDARNPWFSDLLLTEKKRRSAAKKQ